LNKLKDQNNRIQIKITLLAPTDINNIFYVYNFLNNSNHKFSNTIKLHLREKDIYGSKLKQELTDLRLAFESELHHAEICEQLPVGHPLFLNSRQMLFCHCIFSGLRNTYKIVLKVIQQML